MRNRVRRQSYVDRDLEREARAYAAGHGLTDSAVGTEAALTKFLKGDGPDGALVLRRLDGFTSALDKVQHDVNVLAYVRALVAERHYLPTNFHLLKRVVALPGDRVCTEGHRYVVRDPLLSPIADHDQAGRQLTPYPFCSTVTPGTAFVAASGASSLDSRYFGPVSLDDLTPAVPLWTSY